MGFGEGAGLGVFLVVALLFWVFGGRRKPAEDEDEL